MTTLSRNALLAVLLMVGLAFSGCAASDSDGTSSTSSRPVPTRASSTTGGGQTSVVTQRETVTVTQTIPPASSSTSAPPPPPPPPGGGGGGGGATDAMPLVNQTRVLTLGVNSVQIAWNVSDDSPSVTSRVEFGIGDGNFTLSTPDRSGVGPKQETLLGLSACTQYAYRVSARDSAGHTGYGINAVPRFTTTGTAPTVTNITFPTVMHTSITLSWKVNGPADTVTQVQYGTTTAYGSLSETRTGAGFRSVTITGLVQNNDYHFRIRITSPCGSSDTPDMLQRSAQLVHVDIKGSLGATGSFDKGSTLYGPLQLVAGRPYVFEVKNTDSSPHTFNLVCKSEGSGDIPAGQTYTFPKSFVFTTAGTPCHMGCSYHAAMDGTITT